MRCLCGAGCVVGFPLFVFFRDAVGDEIAIEGFDDVAAERGGFGPLTPGFQDGGDTFGRGDVGGSGFEVGSFAHVGYALGDEGDDLTINGIMSARISSRLAH